MPIYYRSKKHFDMVSPDKIQKYIEAVPYITAKYQQSFKCLLALAWLSGMRLIQITTLTTQSSIKIDGLKKEVRVSYLGKKRGKDVVHIYGHKDPFVKSILLPYFRHRKGIFDYDFKLFPYGKRTYQYQLNKLNKHLYPENRYEWLTFHYLRHSRITHLVRVLNMLPQDVKDFTGHRSNAFEEYYQVQKAEKVKNKFGKGF